MKTSQYLIDDYEKLYQMVYVSQITSSAMLRSSTINDIAKTSVQKNTARQITGVLCYGRGNFFQYIEGTEQDLTNLKNDLLLDDRHHQMQILDFSPIAERKFADWSMHSLITENWFINDPKIKSLLPFKPNKWKNGDWQKFLDALVQHYTDYNQTTKVKEQPIAYNAISLPLFKFIGQHQAFFAVQLALLALIIILILFFFFTA